MSDKKEYMKIWRKKNKESLNEYNKKWKENNPEYFKKWREKNKKYILKYYEENREKNLGKCKKYYGKNKKELLKKKGKYQRTEKGKASKQRSITKRRITVKNIINTLTAEEWINILKKYKFRCAYCNKEFTLFDRETRDHIIPISKGGDNIKENIIPACRSCNSKKYNKIIITYQKGEKDE